MKPNTEKHKSDDHRKVEKGLVITRDVVFGDTRTNVFFHPNFEIPLSGHHLTKVDLAMIVFKNKEFHKDQILELCPKTKKWANLFMIGMIFYQLLFVKKKNFCFDPTFVECFCFRKFSTF